MANFSDIWTLQHHFISICCTKFSPSSSSCAAEVYLLDGEQHSSAVRGGCFKGHGDMQPILPSQLSFLCGAEANNSLQSQIDILLMESSGSLATPRELVLAIGEFLQYGPHGSDIERITGILMSQFLGMKNVDELKSVCTCKASWKFSGIK